MRAIEMKNKVAGAGSDVAKLNPFISSIVVLGWVAIFVNIVFLILFFFGFASKKFAGVPRYIAYFNLISLPAQIYYYFFT